MNSIDIAAKSIGMTYGDGDELVSVLDKIDLTIEEGQFVCIVGPSGCGKTTLLRILMGLQLPTVGTVSVRPEQVKEGIAYVQQEAALLPWRTLLQNAALGLESRHPLNEPRIDFLQNLIEEYRLRGFESHLPSELSGGMRQRTAIVRALASRPRILYCDEPFSAIDFVGRLELNTRFKFMCKVEGITVVFVTHNIEEAIFLGDRVLVMRKSPSCIVAEYRPKLSIGAEDAVRCRASPEFGELFQKIWSDLKERNVNAV